MPAELNAAEAESLALLTLESMTPFPMEQLLWGYARDEDAGNMLIYAAYQERLRKAGYHHLEKNRQVFPDFLCLDNSSGEHGATHLLRGETGWTAAAFPAGARFPVATASRALPMPPAQEPGDGEANEAASAPAFDQDAFLEELLGDMDEDNFPVGLTLDALPDSVATEAGNIRFVVNGEEFSHLPEKLVWEADVRDQAFGRRVQTQRRREKWLWKTMVAAAIAALLLLGTDILRWSGDRVVRHRENTIAARASAVLQIGDRNDLVNRLEMRSAGKLRPFLTLQAINQTRPRTLYFTDIEAGDANRYVIDGIASNPNEVNEYAQSLRDLGYFDSVVQENRRVVSGQVNFTLTLVVNELPAAQAAQRPAPEETESPAS